MSYVELLSGMDFTYDPFATTNADEEQMLENYFIEPPFFKAVYGSIRQPKSAIVFAPRGGGKTALKRRIELFSKSDNFLCVTYNTFPIGSKKLSEITRDFHLQNIARIILLGVISSATETRVSQLSTSDRHFLYLLAKAHLNDIDATTLKESIDAVKNLPDAAKEVWNKFTGPIAVVLNAALAHFGFKAAEISEFQQIEAKIGSFTDQIILLSRLATQFGYFSAYVLIDKIDETILTGNKASASLKFIAPILGDLTLLETPGVAFKFFLWDLMEEEASQITRRDRIKHYKLNWTPSQLRDMLSKRLAANSNGIVKSLNQICDAAPESDIDDMVIVLSAGSPRNIIRICNAIFDQQSESNAKSKRISKRAVIDGVNVIAEEFATDVTPPNVLNDLKKLKRADFTQRDVYADTFKITQPAGLTKVQSWQDSGAVAKVGTRQENRANRPSNIYGISNPLVLKYVFQDADVFEFFSKKVRRCGNCDELVLRDWDRNRAQSCQKCQTSMT